MIDEEPRPDAPADAEDSPVSDATESAPSDREPTPAPGRDAAGGGGAENPVPELLPLLPSKDAVLYPFMLLPLAVAEERWVRLIGEVASQRQSLALFLQKDKDADPTGIDDFYPVGTAANLVRMLKQPDGSVQILLQGIARIGLGELITTGPNLTVRAQPLVETVEPGLELDALTKNLLGLFQRLIALTPGAPSELTVAAMNIPEPGRLVDFIAANTDLEVAERQDLLATLDVQERLHKITRLLTHDLEVLEVGSRIQNQIKESMGKGQREYYLREQLKVIQKELGETDSNQAELDDLKAKLDAVGLPEEARTEADRELGRLARIPGASPEYGIVRGYLEWLSELPWSSSTEDDLNLRRAERVLNEDHHDLEKVKDRILDYLAVRNLKGDSRGPILCFAGPPGVGKTSLGQSIARALGRKFIRLALGGVRDESEIRGHRRTYIGALPGRIIQSLRRAGSNNPVIMLDEVDKLSAGFQGDPSAALLEVLDPAQNSTFTDNYLMVPFDLSKVLFIATANQLDPIPPALRDRMEVISLPGYTEDDKLQIARKFLVQRQIAENGLQPGQLRLSDETIRAIIGGYTRESGVRNLEREIGTIARKAARLIASGRGKRLVVSPKRLDDFLGPIRFRSALAEGADEVGVATGLAWTPVGGEILFIEVLAVPGGGNLILTGQLGDVMKESARAALTYARSRAAALGIDLKKADKLDLHVHIPAGAIPKDGPSAGIAMATALISALTRHPINRTVGMTGEVTLRGKVLPIGGLKEKVLAAHRAGLKLVLFPAENQSDLDEIPAHVRRDLKLEPVEHMDRVLELALLPEVRQEQIKIRPAGDGVAAAPRSATRRGKRVS
jgi:ATP-dependent Lon protease